jgi:hypothetical protein
MATELPQGLRAAREGLQGEVSALFPEWTVVGPSATPPPPPAIVVRPEPLAVLARTALEVWTYSLEVLVLTDARTAGAGVPELEAAADLLLRFDPDTDVTSPGPLQWGDASLFGMVATIPVAVHIHPGGPTP